MTIEGFSLFSPKYPAPTVVANVTPDNAGWEFSGLTVIRFNEQNTTYEFDCTNKEAVILPLEGGCQVDEYQLNGRTNVFTSPTDFLYVGGDKNTITIVAYKPAAIAINWCIVPEDNPLPTTYYKQSDADVLVRGAGSATRQLTNYTLNTGVKTHNLLVCEAITPGGNWSSFPPHKHDEHTHNERPLEEVYFFMFRPEDANLGRAYHRTYTKTAPTDTPVEDLPSAQSAAPSTETGIQDSHGRNMHDSQLGDSSTSSTRKCAIDFLAEITHEDTIIIPHGYHGPTVTMPGYDLYGLNVMAGPACDGQWLSTDDPDYAYIRKTWEGMQTDSRLPFF